MMLSGQGRQRRAALLAACALAAGSAGFAAPKRPIRLTVAYPPGGHSDQIARELADRLAALLDVAVIVEHRPGAAGALAMEALARAAPDGNSLVFSAISPLVVLPHLGAQRFDALRDIAPVAAVMVTPVLVLGTPALKARRFDDMISAARSAAAPLRWASSGIATTGHLVLEQVRRASAVDIVHVPYKGGGQQINDALAGHFEVLSSNVARLQLDHVRQGRLKALAVGAPTRPAVLPDTPTLAELGLPEANLSSVFGVFAPGATPPAVLERLHAAISQALRGSALRQHLIEAGNEPGTGARDDFVSLIARESSFYQRLIPPLQAVLR